ncbi:MAG: sugar-binding domain-containing protein, partial [Candidatus Hydrogenedentales bacterium]
MRCLPNYALLPVLLALANTPLFADDIDHWGQRPASPAVVNSVTVSPLQEVISLRGEWDFVTDPMLMGRHRMGKGPAWNEPDWTGVRTIEVPGCWEAQGVGEPGMSLPWDMKFDCIPRPLNHIYMGTARYRRSVEIPSDWDGRRIWLKVGGVRTEAYFWVNQQRVAHVNTYCGSYKFDITDFVKPG